MKILQVINRLNRGGGAEKFVMDLTISLSKSPTEEMSLVSICTPQNEDYTQQLEKNDIKCYTLSTKLYSLSVLFKLYRFLRQHPQDVIHAHLFPTLYYIGLAKFLKIIKCPIIYTEHSTKNKRRKSILLRIIDQFIYRQYDSVIAISEQVKYNLQEHLKIIEPVVINNGISLSEIDAAQTLNLHHELCIDSSVKFVTMIARFVPGKDYLTLFKAIQQLSENIHAVCVGDGPNMKETQMIAHEMKLSNRIHFMGLRSDVISIIKGSDIVVLSTEHEGFSISMLEAMACRNPFVASAVEGINDLVLGVAELFDYQNDKVLTSIIYKLLNDKTFYNKVAERCHLYALKHNIYNIAKYYSDNYMRHYNHQKHSSSDSHKYY